MRNLVSSAVCSCPTSRSPAVVTPGRPAQTRPAPRLLLAAVLAAGGCAGGRPATSPAPAPVPPVAEPAPPAPAARPCETVSSFRAAAPERARLAPLALARAYLAACGPDEITALASTLINFPTVSSREPASTSPAFHGMAEAIRSWSEARGLGFAVVGDHDAWEVTFGEGPRVLGFVVHGDVVPEAPEPAAPGSLPAGWTHPPFQGTVDGGRLYGRGALDDKGPLATVLVTMAALRGAGVKPSGQVVAMIGLGEESDWEGMQRYAGTRTPPENTISVDAAFPLIIGEDGFVAWFLALPNDPPARPRRAVIVDADGGGMLTQVPGEARMTVAPARGETVAGLETRVKAAVARELAARGPGSGFRLESSVDEAAGRVVVRAHGVAVHSSLAETGRNALWPLSGVARRLDPERNGIAAMLGLVKRELDGDPWGQRLGLAYGHPVMGKLVVTADVLRVRDGRVELGINMRRPAGMSSAAFSARLDAALARLRKEIDPRLTEPEQRHVGEPHLVPADEPLAAGLLELYRRETGDATAAPITIRGGTYARLFPGAVSFGPELPGKPSTAHAPDEWVDLDDLELVSRLLVSATERFATAQASGSAP